MPLSEPCQDKRHWHLSVLVEPFCDIPAWPFLQLPLHRHCSGRWEWDGVFPFFLPAWAWDCLYIETEDTDKSYLLPASLSINISIRDI